MSMIYEQLCESLHGHYSTEHFHGVSALRQCIIFDTLDGCVENAFGCGFTIYFIGVLYHVISFLCRIA